jgi:GDPmannose 4,6-dehydratase
VEAMWLMLQQQVPEDFVIATGKAHSVREFVEKAFDAIGIHLAWRGSGIEETAVIDSVSFSENCRNSLKKPPEPGQIVVSIDPRYFRPAEVEFLLGDPTKAETVLGWKPRMGFEELIRTMVERDLMEARRDFTIEKEGFQIYNHFE